MATMLLGYYDRGRLIFGAGSGRASARPCAGSLLPGYKGSRSTDPLRRGLARPDARDARWVEPQLAAEVEFTAWTRDGRVRHPSFKGLREDKRARQVKRERDRR
jgi:bifunctional non-homologous end joining protein LigD